MKTAEAVRVGSVASGSILPAFDVASVCLLDNDREKFAAAVLRHLAVQNAGVLSVGRGTLEDETYTARVVMDSERPAQRRIDQSLAPFSRITGLKLHVIGRDDESVALIGTDGMRSPLRHDSVRIELPEAFADRYGETARNPLSAFYYAQARARCMQSHGPVLSEGDAAAMSAAIFPILASSTLKNFQTSVLGNSARITCDNYLEEAGDPSFDAVTAKLSKVAVRFGVPIYLALSRFQAKELLCTVQPAEPVRREHRDLMQNACVALLQRFFDSPTFSDRGTHFDVTIPANEGPPPPAFVEYLRRELQQIGVPIDIWLRFDRDSAASKIKLSSIALHSLPDGVVLGKFEDAGPRYNGEILGDRAHEASTRQAAADLGAYAGKGVQLTFASQPAAAHARYAEGTRLGGSFIAGLADSDGVIRVRADELERRLKRDYAVDTAFPSELFYGTRGNPQRVKISEHFFIGRGPRDSFHEDAYSVSVEGTTKTLRTINALPLETMVRGCESYRAMGERGDSIYDVPNPIWSVPRTLAMGFIGLSTVHARPVLQVTSRFDDKTNECIGEPEVEVTFAKLSAILANEDLRRELPEEVRRMYALAEGLGKQLYAERLRGGYASGLVLGDDPVSECEEFQIHTNRTLTGFCARNGIPYVARALPFERLQKETISRMIDFARDACDLLPNERLAFRTAGLLGKMHSLGGVFAAIGSREGPAYWEGISKIMAAHAEFTVDADATHYLMGNERYGIFTGGGRRWAPAHNGANVARFLQGQQLLTADDLARVADQANRSAVTGNLLVNLIHSAAVHGTTQKVTMQRLNGRIYGDLHDNGRWVLVNVPRGREGEAERASRVGGSLSVHIEGFRPDINRPVGTLV